VSAGHRHTPPGEHEHEFEPELGLPEPLPDGERMLWQGAPDWQALARRVFHVRKLAAYFAAVLLARGAFVLADGGSAIEALKALALVAPLAVLAVGIALGLAWLTARTTVYTLTDRRLVLRIGIVLTITFNLPLRRIAAAGLRLDGHGHGDLPLTLLPGDKIAFVHLWPHARPWRFSQPEPMLRCLPDAERVAQRLSAAWSAATGLAAVPAPAASADTPRSEAPARLVTS
jgi:hypothetical protein